MQRSRICFSVAAATISIALTACEQPKSAPAPASAAEQSAAAKPEPPKCSDCVPVTVLNFPRAESDLYFSRIVKDGGFGKFNHNRAPTSLDKQFVIRMNRDTLYSAGIFDLDAGPVTITLPDPGKRFLSMQVINEDEYTPMVVYGKGTYTLTKEKVGTRYVSPAIRTLVGPNNPADLEEVHKLQDAIKVSQKSTGTFEIPKWDKASQDKVRDALLVLAATVPDTKQMFGTKEQTEPVRHLLGSATGWGGNPDKDAAYLFGLVKDNDGTGVYKVTVRDVPVAGFWSISLYNGEGYFEKNPYNAYSVNNITGTKNPEFGGCDGKVPNCLPIMKGWNYAVRLYRPRVEILSGKVEVPRCAKSAVRPESGRTQQPKSVDLRKRRVSI